MSSGNFQQTIDLGVVLLSNGKWRQNNIKKHVCLFYSYIDNGLKLLIVRPQDSINHFDIKDESETKHEQDKKQY